MKEKNFIDETWINIKPGNGGNGLATFHKEKGLNRGGPSGGNGGNGGSIVFKGNSGENTLLDFKTNKVFKAENGGNGGSNNKTGHNGKDLIIEVPLGTQFFLENEMIFEITKHNQKVIAFEGGKGGRGNSSFKSSKNSSPMLYENGEKTFEIKLKMELKLLADVGILGFPNAGKSTFISSVSNAKPQIADYPFTTITPKLGLVKHNDFKFVISDLPGLIEGASENKGMGFRFLKHLERTKIIIHLIDISEGNLLEKYKTLRKELKKFSDKLIKKEEIIVFNKIDMINEKEIEKIKKEWKDFKLFFISSLKKENLNSLLNEIVNVLKKYSIVNEEKNENDDYIEYIYKKKNNDDLSFEIEKNNDDWLISGKYIEYWANRIPLTNSENFWRLYQKMNSKGIIKKLKDEGMQEGDYIKIINSNFEMQYYDK